MYEYTLWLSIQVLNMLHNLIFVFKVALILLTLFMVGYFLWDGYFWAAGGMFVTFLSFLYWFVNGWDVDFSVLSILATVITMFSAADYFTNSDATDLELQSINRQLLMEFTKISYCPESYQPNQMMRTAFKELKKVAYMKCAMQQNDDFRSLSIDLAKAVHLPTSVGFSDTLYNEFLNNKEVVRCVDLAKVADRLCPNLLRTKIPPHLL